MACAVLEDVDGIGNEGRALEMMRTRSKKELVLVRVEATQGKPRTNHHTKRL